MFEKEAEEYVMREDVITENDRVPFDNGYGFQTVSFEDEVKKGFKDGAEFGYNKAKEEMQEQIEKMKCCGNCKYFNFNEPNYCHKGVYRERQYVCSEWEFGN